ncbi:MAG TPA: hypothetical protein VFW73_13110 [Lacipirellulaceae bacterium]|nr:hypothetical protein [Lacipirellulaceae bacterium]
MEHAFTSTMVEILRKEFGKAANDVLQSSPLLQYLNIKTRSAARGSKSRGAFANHYAVYVLVEDYVKKGYLKKRGYAKYEGARFTDLLRRQRELPFGAKLQNHALNSRMNDEFRKYFPSSPFIPITRNVTTNRYWINEKLLVIEIAGKKYNIAPSIIKIIDAYVAAKRDAFETFIAACEKLQRLKAAELSEVQAFIKDLLQPNVDARVFEIVSFGILRHFYAGQAIYWGWSMGEINEECLTLYKTGRTNANDGGIDFVMRPLGRFFQVTETTDVRKYLLDIDKVQKYPITFVIKSEVSVPDLTKRMQKQAREAYGVDEIVRRYMGCVEEIINIPVLLDRFDTVVKEGKLPDVLNEVIVHSKVEFHYQENPTARAESRDAERF